MVDSDTTDPVQRPSPVRAPWLFPAISLVLLAGVAALIFAWNPVARLTNAPPAEELDVRKVELTSEGITLHIVNAGPDPVTVAQLLVDEAYWEYSISPQATLGRLARATIQLPYPWVEGEAHEVVIITSTGTTFAAEIEVAVETPQSSGRTWLLFGLVGIYVGPVPVLLGLLWFPALRSLGKRGMAFILSLTVGLLVFLLVDTVLEALEFAAQIPDVLQAVPLVIFVSLLTFLVLFGISRREATGGDERNKRLWLATAIAIGIGLHNLGEGMAIGAAVALGETALGTFLILGFTLHNLTEGIAIGSPVASDRPGARRLIVLAIVAGSPAIVGTWVGGFAFSPLAAVVFLAIGAGAILQVVYEVSGIVVRRGERQFLSVEVLVGFVAGIAVMYLTGLLVKF
jgi:ZIP family zinc transporter